MSSLYLNLIPCVLCTFPLTSLTVHFAVLLSAQQCKVKGEFKSMQGQEQLCRLPSLSASVPPLQVVYNNLCPQWNEFFRVSVCHYAKKLLFRVKDQGGRRGGRHSRPPSTQQTPATPKQRRPFLLTCLFSICSLASLNAAPSLLCRYQAERGRHIRAD